MAEQTMTCAIVRETVRRGEVPTDQAHLASCPACRALVDGALVLSPYMEAAPDISPLNPAVLREQLHSALEAETGWRGRAQAMPTPTRLAILALLTLGVVAAAGLFSPRADLAMYPVVRMWMTVLCTVGVGLASGAVSLRPIQHSAPRTSAVGGFIFVGVLLAVLPALLPLAHPETAESVSGGGSAFILDALMCWAFGIAIALPVVIAFWILDRSVRPTRAPALLAGLGAGLAGVAGLQLHCPINIQTHLLLGHTTVVLSLLGAGLLFLRVRPSRASPSPGSRSTMIDR